METCHDRIAGGRCHICLTARAVQGATPFRDAPNLGALVVELLKSKRIAGRREVYIASLSNYLLRFAKGREDLPASRITVQDVDAYLSGLSGHNRATHLNRISTLFSYAVRRGYIASNPCDRIERATIDRQTPRILTPDEARHLYELCPESVRPYLVLCLYAGIRPDESRRLMWSDVDLAERRVTINAAASKVRARRLVPLEDIAVELLKRHPDKTGPIAPSVSTVRRFKRAARSVVGKWPADLLRHTAASYLLAKHENAGKVALWLGNSVQILLTHYQGLATKAAAEQFYPSEKRSKISDNNAARAAEPPAP